VGRPERKEKVNHLRERSDKRWFFQGMGREVGLYEKIGRLNWES